MTMVIRNMSDYPDEEVRRLVKFAVSEVDMRRVCVKVKNARNRRFRGMAYDCVPFRKSAPPSSTRLVTIGLGSPDVFPFLMNGWMSDRARMPKMEIRDWRDLLVAIAAHEAKHIEQFKEGIRNSEVACETFAAYMLRRFREENGHEG